MTENIRPKVDEVILPETWVEELNQCIRIAKSTNILAAPSVQIRLHEIVSRLSEILNIDEINIQNKQ